MADVLEGQFVPAALAEDKLIARFQENLAAIRKVAGMTSQELADEVGVSRQTINSLEHGKTKMSKTQYLALRSIFNFRAANSQALAQVIKALIDDPVVELEDIMDEAKREVEAHERERKDDASKLLLSSAVLGASALTAALATPVLREVAAASTSLPEMLLKALFGRAK